MTGHEVSSVRAAGMVRRMDPERESEQHDPDRIRDPLEDLEPSTDEDSPGVDPDFAEAAEAGAGDEHPAPSG